MQINGVDKSNYHIYRETNAKGKKCIKAYESKSEQYFIFKKCHDNTNDAYSEILNATGNYSLADKIHDAFPWAVAILIIAWMLKIVLSIILANPAPLLIPV